MWNLTASRSAGKPNVFSRSLTWQACGRSVQQLDPIRKSVSISHGRDVVLFFLALRVHSSSSEVIAWLFADSVVMALGRNRNRAQTLRRLDMAIQAL